MAAIFFCDGYGKHQTGEHNGLRWVKLSEWFGRTAKDNDGKDVILNVCSRSCVDRVNAGRDEQAQIIPF